MSFFYSILFYFFCFCGISLTQETQNHGFSVELIHPSSSKSPFYNRKETHLQRVSNILNHSINRAHYLNRVFSFSHNNMPKSTITPFAGSNYFMSYSIGTPPFQLYGAVDTGSSEIWFQCKPCKPCLNQTSQMFDPSKSSTYKNIPCSSSTCKRFSNSPCSSNDKKKCEYKVSYLDRSYSHGDLSTDTLTLNSIVGSPISFSKIVIGCGHQNTLTNVTTAGSNSGIIGFGSGPYSLISQLGSSIGGKFSYCLVPLFSKANISGKLNFGDAAKVSGHGVVSTRLVQPSTNPSYNAYLDAFSVGDHIIKVNQSSTIYVKQGNAIIDSGTTITYLSDDVYSKLESAMASMVKLKRVNDPTKQLNLCYKTPSKKYEIPIITAHFRGADVKLNALNTFIPINHKVVCFAFSSFATLGAFGNSPLIIYGNVAQQNFLVSFDIQKNIVSFKPTDCAKQ
jgi:hypothetical protein